MALLTILTTRNLSMMVVLLLANCKNSVEVDKGGGR